MATLTQDSLSLSIIHLERDEHTVYMGLGLFCDGVPLLTPLLAYTDPKIPTGYVEVEDRAGEEVWMTKDLRPVLTEKWPQFWHNDAEEFGGEIIVYPSSFHYVVHPSRNIPWNEVLPAIGKAAAVHFRYSIEHRSTDPPMDPQLLGLDEDSCCLTVHVHVGARLLGRKGGDVGYRSKVLPEQFAAFLDEVDRERHDFLSRVRSSHDGRDEDAA